MNKNEYKGVFVFVQQVDGVISGVSFELIGCGKQLANDLGTEVTAVLLGHDIAALPAELAKAGADRVMMADAPELKTYMTEPYTHVMAGVIQQKKPEVVLFGATAIGRDLAPRVAARIHTGLTADCTKLDIDSETKNLRMTRPAFGGNIMATILCPENRPQMATVRSGVMQRLEGCEGTECPVEKLDINVPDSSLNVEIREIVKKAMACVDIQCADILISGGRGMGCPENFKVLHNLADALGGTVSASRAAVDAGWIEKERQVGQTGKTVRPKVYIACGISGAIQHLAGMEESDIIIAINKDSTAPIFEVADYGIVGDLFKVLPLFTKEAKKLLALRK